jgi:uncharacterized protein (TIGR03083 family)
MEVAAHIEALQHHGALMVAAASAAGPNVAVATCPDWTVRDLVRHMGGVHRWATGYVRDRRTEVWNVDLDDVVGSWPADDALGAWLGEGCAALVDALAAAPADLECWSFLPAPSPLAMWARRQAHETAIHRVDAELAAGRTPSAVSTDFAADGADELLTCFVPRRSGRLRADSPTALRVACTDDDASWLLRIDTEGVTTSPGSPRDDDEAACTVRGSAADVYLALWNRTGAETLSVEGDRDVLALFSDAVQVRWA